MCLDTMLQPRPVMISSPLLCRAAPHILPSSNLLQNLSHGPRFAGISVAASFNVCLSSAQSILCICRSCHRQPRSPYRCQPGHTGCLRVTVGCQLAKICDCAGASPPSCGVRKPCAHVVVTTQHNPPPPTHTHTHTYTHMHTHIRTHESQADTDMHHIRMHTLLFILVAHLLIRKCLLAEPILISLATPLCFSTLQSPTDAPWLLSFLPAPHIAPYPYPHPQRRTCTCTATWPNCGARRHRPACRTPRRCDCRVGPLQWTGVECRRSSWQN